jgi:hypothetical protein
MGFLALIASLAIAGSFSTSGNGAIDALGTVLPLPETSLSPPPDSVKGPSFPIATVRAGHRIALHASPGGRVVARTGSRTEFGSMRVFWIERVRGAWFGVPAPELPDGQLAWIRDDRFALDVSQTQFWIDADVSRQILELHYGQKLLDRFPVTVGSATSPTPLGDYSVTDGLVGKGLGPWYGCCALALSGHQTKLVPGWPGGDRLAIHGTPNAETVGTPASLGCMRAYTRDIRALMRAVPLGAPVFIRA